MDEYKIEWFSGTGKGGQHRNKHQNCCRVTHLSTGIKAQGTGSKSRETNKKNALAVCKSRVLKSLHEDTERFRAGSVRIRTYHAERNIVTDHASGETLSFRGAMQDISKLIKARAEIMRVI